MLDRLDPLLATPVRLSENEFSDLVAFVRDALLDYRARKENLCGTIPFAVPSGMTLADFEECGGRR